MKRFKLKSDLDPRLLTYLYVLGRGNLSRTCNRSGVELELDCSIRSTPYIGYNRYCILRGLPVTHLGEMASPWPCSYLLQVGALHDTTSQ